MLEGIRVLPVSVAVRLGARVIDELKLWITLWRRRILAEGKSACHRCRSGLAKASARRSNLANTAFLAGGIEHILAAPPRSAYARCAMWKTHASFSLCLLQCRE